MRILVIGATGTIGSAIDEALVARSHDVVRVGSTSGDLTVDLSDPASIRSLYSRAHQVDAVVCAAGRATFGPLDELSDEDFQLGIDNKMMGQVNLVRHGIGIVTERGSFTLTSGTLSTKPDTGSAAVSMVGAGVEAFARAAAIDLAGQYRVNVVSPGWVAETRQKMGLEPMPGIWARDLAEYYVDFVEGDATGRVAEAEDPKS